MPRHWLLVGEREEVGDAIAARLRGEGDRCLRIHRGEHYGFDGADEAMLGPDVAGDCRRLLAELRASGVAVHGALHLGSLADDKWERVNAPSLAAAQRQGVIEAALLAQALLAHSPAPRLWMITRGAQQAAEGDVLDPAAAPVWGLGKALALEHPELRAVCCDLDPAAPGDSVDALFAELHEPGLETQVAFRAGERVVARLARVRPAAAATRSAASGSYRLAPAVPGSLDSLQLQPSTRRTPGRGEVEIAVEATGLNFKDVLNVLGMYPGDPGPLGGECAGRVSAVGDGVTQLRPGDAVLAVAGGSFASHVVARAEFVQRRPQGMGAEAAASFPIAFLTAQFCLGHLAGMRAGERVLIHAAAGGVGMAAVRLAQRAGAQVFATAGSASKRELLRDMGVTYVFDSRSAAFADEVLAATDGHGVDIVLNSLAGELIDASFRALARGGRFIEMGKRGIKTAQWVQSLDRHVAYFVVDWGEVAERDSALIGAMLAELVDDLRQGRLQPLPHHVFGLDEPVRAFRFMAQARHHGKIVVRHTAPAAPAIRRDGSYLVTGGLSGLGPEVARWLAQRGAGRLVLVGRRGVTPEAAPVIESLRASGVEVIVEAADVSDEGALRELLARVRVNGAPLRGIVHGAGVLDDAGLLQLDAARFERVFAPKVQGAFLLDRLTRQDALDFFVLFSSIAAVLGSRGQANHAGANAFLDVLARERASRGLPALSINWGAWSQVGAAAERAVAERIAAQGIAVLTPAQGLLALERLLAQPRAQVAVLPIDWARHVGEAGLGATPAFLCEVAGQARTASAAKAPRGAPAADLRERVFAAPAGRQRALVATFVRCRALKALGVDPSRTIDPRTPLGEWGLDSLLAVELRNTLGTALGQVLPATLLFDHPTIDALTEFILAQLALPSDAAPAAEATAAAEAAPSSAGLVDAIEDLSDEEVERMLAARATRVS